MRASGKRQFTAYCVARLRATLPPPRRRALNTGPSIAGPAMRTGPPSGPTVRRRKLAQAASYNAAGWSPAQYGPCAGSPRLLTTRAQSAVRRSSLPPADGQHEGSVCARIRNRRARPPDRQARPTSCPSRQPRTSLSPYRRCRLPTSSPQTSAASGMHASFSQGCPFFERLAHCFGLSRISILPAGRPTTSAPRPVPVVPQSGGLPLDRPAASPPVSVCLRPKARSIFHAVPAACTANRTRAFIQPRRGLIGRMRPWVCKPPPGHGTRSLLGHSAMTRSSAIPSSHANPLRPVLGRNTCPSGGLGWPVRQVCNR